MDIYEVVRRSPMSSPTSNATLSDEELDEVMAEAVSMTVMSLIQKGKVDAAVQLLGEVREQEIFERGSDV